MTNVGTSSAAVFNFGIPKGADGPGTGTVTSVSLVPANGFGGSVNTATTTPSIVITCAVTGMVKGNGTVASAATPGTDYVAPGTGTALSLYGVNSGGNAVPVSLGTNLTMGGGNVLNATGGGALVRIGSPQTVSGASTIAFTGLSGYSRYLIKLEGVYPSVGDVLILQIGTGSTPTWLASGYSYTAIFGSSGSAANIGGTSLSGFYAAGGNNEGASLPGLNGDIEVFNALATSGVFFTSDVGFFQAGVLAKTNGSGTANPGATPTAMRLAFVSGATITGTATLYAYT